MLITVSGVPKEVAEGITITKLLENEKIENPEYVSVSVNDEFVASGDFAAKKLSENDTVEFLYFMGGGSF